MSYNLKSPNGLITPCNLADLDSWYADELRQVSSRAERSVLKVVGGNLEAFVRWPKEAILLWPGCNRIPDAGMKHKYHSFPNQIRQMAKTRSICLDSRPNGPAIASFLLAGGERPERFGSSNAWSIHHLYSGKFPYCGRQLTTHSSKQGIHFTQSAGLIAAHPVADALVDEFPFFAWLLRANSFARFGYDPDHVFSAKIDKFGFSISTSRRSGAQFRKC
jgi:hypothetical protein